MTTIATLLAKLQLDTTGFQASVSKIPGMLNNAGGNMQQLGGSITRGITVPVGLASVAVLALGADALTTGANFESAMSGVGSILGATKDQIVELSNEAIRLGMDPNLVVTATEAAGAMEELAKNGLTATEILNGAAEATIALSNATGVDLATGAQIASTAMQLFNIDAENMSVVVDQVTAVANMSRFTAEDFALAVGMGGAAAKSAGVEFEEFTAVIAALSTVTSSGSDAGTSFKTFLTRLVPISDSATEAMKELGIITEEGSNRFFDAAGNMKSMAEIAGILQETLSGLSEEQRISALHSIFGADASRAAIGLMQQGEQGFLDLMAAMAETDAAENAATRMDNLKGVLEILGGVLEGFKIKFTQAIGPGLRAGVESLTAFLASNSTQIENLFSTLSEVFLQMGQNLGPWLEENGPKMIAFFTKMIESLPLFISKLVELGTIAAPHLERLFNLFISMDPNTIANIISAIGALAFLGPVIASIGGLITTLATLWTMISGIGTAFTTVAGVISGATATIGALITGGILLPLLLIIGTAALVYLAFRNNFMGITTTVQQLWFIIQWAFTQIGQAIAQLIQKIIELAKAFAALVIPDVLTPGSPTPFEIGLRGILDAMQGINSAGLPGIEGKDVRPPGVREIMPRGSGINNSENDKTSEKNIQITINNPKKESSEETIRKQMKNLSYLGVMK